MGLATGTTPTIRPEELGGTKRTSFTAESGRSRSKARRSPSRRSLLPLPPPLLPDRPCAARFGGRVGKIATVWYGKRVGEGENGKADEVGYYCGTKRERGCTAEAMAGCDTHHEAAKAAGARNDRRRPEKNNRKMQQDTELPYAPAERRQSAAETSRRSQKKRRAAGLVPRDSQDKTEAVETRETEPRGTDSVRLG